MEAEVIKDAAPHSTLAQRVIAAGILVAFFYFASHIVITLAIAVLLGYFLDPLVKLLERIHVPRALGALMVLLAVTGVFVGVGFAVVNSANRFVAGWPRYREVIHRVTTDVDEKLNSIESQVQEITPTAPPAKGRRAPAQNANPTPVPPIHEWLVRGAGSVSTFLLDAAFLPFLVFFMLAAKPHLARATVALFPMTHQVRAQQALDDIRNMIRSFVVGNALVAFILMMASWACFALLHLDNAFLAGSVSGILNIVPYLGVVLAWIPPFLMGLAQWHTIVPYIIVASTLTVLHFVSLNVLMPAFVGHRVHLNAFAVTVSFLFWGWMWGAMGLLLAIPVTAAIKVICDHADGWQPVGRWLGE